MEKINKELYLLQDWTDFDKSRLNDLSTEYYEKAGLDAFSKKNNNLNIVPHLVTTSFPHAKNLVQILKANLDKLPAKRKVRILECGAGTGIFSRNFLLAAREIGLLDHIEYIISDISELSLKQIKEKKILGDFIEDEHYKFVVLDLLNFEAAKDLNAKAFEIIDLDLVVLNYVVDILPMLPVKKITENSFEKQQIRILCFKNDEINISAQNSLASLITEQQWVSIDLDSLEPQQQKFINILKLICSKNPTGKEIRYSYAALEVFEILNSRLSENGIVYIADIPSPTVESLSIDKHYSLYGNTKANYIQESLLISHFGSLGYSHLDKKEANLSRLLFFKNKSTANNSTIKNLFLRCNELEIFSQIIRMFPMITDSALVNVAKALLDKLLEIDSKSCTALTLQGSYYFLTKDYEKAMEFYKKAQTIDFSDQWDLDRKIYGTEAFIQ